MIQSSRITRDNILGSTKEAVEARLTFAHSKHHESLPLEKFFMPIILIGSPPCIVQSSSSIGHKFQIASYNQFVEAVKGQVVECRLTL